MIEIRWGFKSRQCGKSEILQCLLNQLGISQDRIAEKFERGRTHVSLFVKSYKQALRIREETYCLKLKGITTSLIPLKDSDWKTRWKKYFRPFNITKGIRVIPSGIRDLKAKKSGQAIYIDTTLAFGTGLHPSTQLTAQLIETKKGHFRNFLDIGTGSGILSIIAHRYGAENIWALDIDKKAIRTARQNFQKNHCRPRYLKANNFAYLRKRGYFDLVVANLFTEELIRFQDQLASCVRPGKYLAVSGISANNFSSFRKRFKSKELKCLRISKRQGWYAVMFRRNGPRTTVPGQKS